MFKILNSDFLNWEDTLVGKHLSIPVCNIIYAILW